MLIANNSIFSELFQCLWPIAGLLNHRTQPGRPAFGPEMLQTNNYSLVLLIQLSLLTFDLFVNSFSELLRAAPVVQLVLFIIQDIAILFNLIIILLMLFNTYVFQNLRWLKSNRYVWTDGLQVIFVFQRIASVLYYYFYKRTTEYLGDPRLYEDSPWLRDAFANARARQ
ncbi:unnamed protein product [Coregonus sp. 'balchen']|nr:unnamed protein product [Coregonus sp. 'balchen']